MPTLPDGIEYVPSITLRDYFAAQAMAGMLAAETEPIEHRPSWDVVAERAYEQADAMLAEREKGEGSA